MLNTVTIYAPREPRRFSYRAIGNFGIVGYFIFEGDRFIASTNEEVYAKVICTALNWHSAFLRRMPIVIGGSDARN